MAEKFNFKTEITRFHYGIKSEIPLLIRPVLKFASLFYCVITDVRNFMYDHYILPINCVNARVISVGNITTGGVGKTPFVAELAKYYADQYGERVCILSRGYGGRLNNKNVHVIKDVEGIKYSAEEAGDEPYWLAQNTPPEVIVITCSNRSKSAEFAVNKYNVTKIILDDGFQHRSLHRDSDIILVDSQKKFGNGCVLPYGPLREKMSNINRSDRIFVVSKASTHEKAEFYAKELESKYGKKTRVCRVEPDIIYDIKTGELLSEEEPLSAVCAIGQPEQFISFLHGKNIVEQKIYEDHHRYSADDFKNIKGSIITTEKDAVKIKMLNIKNRVYALKLKTKTDFQGIID